MRYRTNYFEEDDTIEEGSSQDASESPDPIKATNNNDAVIIDVVKSGPLLPPALDVDRVLLNGIFTPTLPSIYIIISSMLSIQYLLHQRILSC